MADEATPGTVNEHAAVHPIFACDDPDFQAAAMILPQTELSSDAGSWRPGDTVLLGLRFVHSDRATVRLLKVELTGGATGGSFEWTDSRRMADGSIKQFRNRTGLAMTNLTLYDQQGQVLQHAHGNFGIRLLGAGIYDGLELIVDRDDTPETRREFDAWSDEQFCRASKGYAALFAFSMSMGKPGMFKGLTDSIVSKPGLLTMIFHRSLSLNSEGLVKSGPGWACPDGRTVPSAKTTLVLSMGSHRLLRGEVTAVHPMAPLSLCGGIVAAEAAQPDDRAHRVEIRLLGAKLGTGDPQALRTIDSSFDDGI